MELPEQMNDFPVLLGENQPLPGSEQSGHSWRPVFEPDQVTFLIQGDFPVSVYKGLHCLSPPVDNFVSLTRKVYQLISPTGHYSLGQVAGIQAAQIEIILANVAVETTGPENRNMLDVEKQVAAVVHEQERITF